MRVLHVVTYVSHDNSFGGPVTVALQQMSALQDLGVVPTLSGLSDQEMSGQSALKVHTNLFRSRRIPGLGFAGEFAPSLLTWAADHLRDFDVIHIHLARDMSTLVVASTARRLGVPYVVQTHGMIDPSRRLLSVPLDAALTRPALRRSSRLLYLTDTDRRGVEAVARSTLPATRMPNAITPASTAADPASSREVLFVGRLEPRKRARDFVEAAHRLVLDGSDLQFSIIGPDQGDLAPTLARIRELGLEARVRYEGPQSPSAVHDRIHGARMVVLPSVREPYPMVLLEAMAHGVPVVCTTQCGLAKTVAELETGLVVSPGPSTVAVACQGLAEDDAWVARLGGNGFQAAHGPFNAAHIGPRLLAIYEEAIG